MIHAGTAIYSRYSAYAEQNWDQTQRERIASLTLIVRPSTLCLSSALIAILAPSSAIFTKPSPLMAPLNNERVTEAARKLDQKLEALVPVSTGGGR